MVACLVNEDSACCKEHHSSAVLDFSLKSPCRAPSKVKEWAHRRTSHERQATIYQQLYRFARIVTISIRANQGRHQRPTRKGPRSRVWHPSGKGSAVIGGL